MRKLFFFINVDWYYELHWQERILSAMTDGFEVHVCMATEPGADQKADRPSLFEGREVVYHDIPMHRTSAGITSNLKAFLAVRRLLREIEPDLIHTVTIKPNLLGGILARWSRRPILLTLPGLGTVFSETSTKNRLLKALILALYRWIAGNPRAALVFENEADRTLFRSEGVLPPGGGYLSPGSGVDTERFRPSARSAPTPPLTVLFAARLLNQKGLDDLVAAAERRRAAGQEIRLLVAGIQDPSAPDAIDMRVIEEWHAAGRIEWLGRVGEMESLFRQAHVVALPTKYGEGIPRILIEAAACGLPVLTTDVGGCREFVLNGTTGRTVAPGDIGALAAALKEMQDDSLREAMGRAARARVEASYSRSHVIDTFRGIYSDLS